MLSIIIPTLNEEKHLPLLLESIKKQNFLDCEIIVADANSTDKTLEIAQKYGCKIIKGGLPGKARNEGAKIATGDLLLFLDADVLLPSDFFANFLKEFENKKFDVATFPLFFTGGTLSMATSRAYNWWVVITQPFLPHAFGAALLAKKQIYEKIGGFDEAIKLAEDHDFARRAKKIAKCGIIKSTHIFVSDRRFRADGWLKMCFKYILIEFYMVFVGPIKSDIFSYKFNHYNDNKRTKK